MRIRTTGKQDGCRTLGGREVYYLESLGELPALRTLSKMHKETVRCSQAKGEVYCRHPA